MKLYTAEETHKPNLTLEQYRDMFETSEVISQESLSDFLYKIADAFNNVYTSIISKYTDDDVKEIFSYKLEVQNKVKHLDFTLTSENIVTIPENFKGKYIDYVTDLHTAASDLFKLTIESGDLTKMALGDFINNSNLDKLNTLYGYAKVELQAKIAAKHKDNLTKYFPYSNGVDKASLRTVLKTYGDVRPIMEQVEKLDQLINKDSLQAINTIYNTISDLLNHLIDEVSTQNIKINNTAIKKDLEKMLYNFNSTMSVFGYAVYSTKNFYMALLQDVNVLIEM